MLWSSAPLVVEEKALLQLLSIWPSEIGLWIKMTRAALKITIQCLNQANTVGKAQPGLWIKRGNVRMQKCSQFFLCFNFVFLAKFSSHFKSFLLVLQSYYWYWEILKSKLHTVLGTGLALPDPALSGGMGLDDLQIMLPTSSTLRLRDGVHSCLAENAFIPFDAHRPSDKIKKQPSNKWQHWVGGLRTPKDCILGCIWFSPWTLLWACNIQS